jgi:glycosyltransferase involved in cell wall biosynthesis
MKEEFRISVIIPVYNAANYLQRAVESAVEHDVVKEILLIDDGSKDNSVEVCNRLAQQYPSVKVLRHPNGENRGSGPTRNLGIQQAAQPFIAFLDSDDVYLPNRFDAEKQILTADTDIDGVYGALGVFYFGKNERTDIKQFKEGSLTTLNRPVDAIDLKWALLDFIPAGSFSIDALTIKKAAVMECGMFPALKWHQDTVFIIKLAFGAKMVAGILHEPVGLRGVHDNNNTSGNRKISFTREQMYNELIRWTTSVNMPRAVVHMLRAKQLPFALNNRNKLGALLLFIKECMSNKYLRRYSYFFNPAVDALFPKNLAQLIIRLKEAYYVRIKRWNTDNQSFHKLLRELNHDLTIKH